MALLTCYFPVLLLAGLASTGIIVDTDFENTNPDTVNGEDLFEGDILFTPEQKMMLMSKKALSSLTSRWPNGPNGYPLVPYRYIDDQVDRAAIELAIAHWEEHTCIRFEETDDSYTNPHIQFHLGSGCWSYVGMIAGWSGQKISIGNGCNYLGIIVHEIGHTLGFYHEQSRSDRDSYVEIKEENINPDYISNFHKKNDLNYSVPYDLTSVMHYGAWAFTLKGDITIMTLIPWYQSLLGQRSGLSHYDKLLANKMYPCIANWLETCNMSSDPCQNNGYTGADCTCVCPAGTSGDNCETVTGDYYDQFISECNEEITEEVTITSPNYPGYYKVGLSCVTLIQAPECHRVRLTFNYFQIYQKVNEVCVYDRFEVRTNHPNLGDVYCDNDISVGQTFYSSSDLMILIFSTRSSGFHTGYTADVSFVPIAGCGSFPLATCTEDVVDENLSHWLSPNFGVDDYQIDDFCSIARSSSSPKWARIQLKSFDLEPEVNGECNDYVNFSNIFNFENITLCGYQSGREIRLPSYNFVANFNSDLQNTDAGFEIVITAETSECHMVIEGDIGETGTLVVPNSANNVWERKACEWWITSPTGTKIEVEFGRSRLGRSCSDGSVIINPSGDIFYHADSSIQYCGFKKSVRVSSIENKINILFFSVNSKTQMTATYTVVAG